MFYIYLSFNIFFTIIVIFSCFFIMLIVDAGPCVVLGVRGDDVEPDDAGWLVSYL